MRSGLSVILLFHLLGGLAPGQAETAHTLRIVFAGDIMGHDSQIAAARFEAAEKGSTADQADTDGRTEPAGREGDTNRIISPAGDGSPDQYDYRRCFHDLAPYLENADIAVGNLEVTLGGPPFKGYPRFSSPDELGEALLEAGFDVLVNANNHALDRGKEGLERTISVIGREGMIQTGVFSSPDQREMHYPLILEKNGILLALLNYTYGTNSLVPDTPNVINYLDTLLIRRDIRKARLVDPDFIVAVVHWGQEYQREENKTQQALAAFLFDEGVDAVIGSHPHVVQPIIYDRDGGRIVRPVVYSLGNFISNQRDRYRNGGIIVGLNLEKTVGRGTSKSITSITGIDYLPVYVHKPREGNRSVFELVPGGIQDGMLSRIGFTQGEKESYLEFCRDTREHLPDVPLASVPTGQ